MPRRWVTIRDVSARAGVSPTLVSFHLTGRQPISAEAARRIKAAIEELDYHPNATARNLRLKRSGVVGLMVPYLTNPTFGIIATAAEAALARGQLLTVTCSAGGDPERRQAYFQALRSSRAEGLLVFPGADIAGQIVGVAQHGIRVVLMVRDIPKASSKLPMDAVIVNPTPGVRQATQHLLELGHTRIALINLGRDSLSSAERHQGYLQALSAAGQNVEDERIAWYPGTVQGGYEAIHHLLRSSAPPTGLVVTTNLQTVGVLSAISEIGLEMPRDLSVIGWGHPGFELWPAIPLTMISEDVGAVGRIAGEMLLSRLSGKESSAQLRISLDTGIEIKGSTGPPPGRSISMELR